MSSGEKVLDHGPVLVSRNILMSGIQQKIVTIIQQTQMAICLRALAAAMIQQHIIIAHQYIRMLPIFPVTIQTCLSGGISLQPIMTEIHTDASPHIQTMPGQRLTTKHQIITV